MIMSDEPVATALLKTLSKCLTLCRNSHWNLVDDWKGCALGNLPSAHFGNGEPCRVWMASDSCTIKSSNTMKSWGMGPYVFVNGSVHFDLAYSCVEIRLCSVSCRDWVLYWSMLANETPNRSSAAKTLDRDMLALAIGTEKSLACFADTAKNCLTVWL